MLTHLYLLFHSRIYCTAVVLIRADTAKKILPLRRKNIISVAKYKLKKSKSICPDEVRLFPTPHLMSMRFLLKVRVLTKELA